MFAYLSYNEFFNLCFDRDMVARKEISIVPVLFEEWGNYFNGLSPFRREVFYLQGCSGDGCGLERVFSCSENVEDEIVHEMVVVLDSWDDLWTWSRASLAALRGNKESQVVYVLPSYLPKESVEKAFMGWTMAHRSPSWKPKSKKIPALEYRGEFDEFAKRGLLLANIINKSRYLIEAPAESMGPDELEEYAHKMAAENDLQINVIKGDDLSEGFPLVHAVGRASARLPRVIEMNYPRGDGLDLCLIGKGICFDTGGVNLKPSGAMRLMRKDMGGGCYSIWSCRSNHRFENGD